MKTLHFSLAIVVLSFLFVFSSCNKDEEAQVDPQYVIKGVELYDVNANIMGTIGMPENNQQLGDLKMDLYPVPCKGSFMMRLWITNREPVAVKINLIHVVYPDAPASYNYKGVDEPILVENRAQAGQVALTDNRDLKAASGGQHFDTLFDVSNLPKGFFKVTIDVSDGRKLHMATFIQ